MSVVINLQNLQDIVRHDLSDLFRIKDAVGYIEHSDPSSL